MRAEEVRTCGRMLSRKVREELRETPMTSLRIL
jgi:hypothetical protein